MECKNTEGQEGMPYGRAGMTDFVLISILALHLSLF
jgi:hypothetical protein